MDKLLNSLSLNYLMYWVDHKVCSSFSYVLKKKKNEILGQPKRIEIIIVSASWVTVTSTRSNLDKVFKNILHVGYHLCVESK